MLTFNLPRCLFGQLWAKLRAYNPDIQANVQIAEVFYAVNLKTNCELSYYLGIRHLVYLHIIQYPEIQANARIAKIFYSVNLKTNCELS
jgi:hypothetical protein